jgi:hypothetical protein
MRSDKRDHLQVTAPVTLGANSGPLAVSAVTACALVPKIMAILKLRVEQF